MTRVILLERIDSLGRMGDIVSVRPGFARNYLLPYKKALLANETNMKVFESKKQHIEQSSLEKKKIADALFSKIDGFELTIIRSASEVGHLYGSVRNKDISEELQSQGFSIHKTQVQILSPIKFIGRHEVFVNLHPDVKAKIMINIAKSQEEASHSENDDQDVIPLMAFEEISERD